MTIKVFDTFTGTIGTDISAHTPNTDVVGGGWTDNGANTVELDGSGAIKFAAQNDNCWIDSGDTDQLAVTNFNAGGTDNRIGVHLRADGNLTTGTNYFFNFKPGAGANNLVINKTISGSNTALATKNLSLSTSVTYEVGATVIGTSLDFIVNTISELTTTDASISTGTNAGLSHAKYSNGDARFFDFEVDDGAGGGISIPVIMNQLRNQGIS